MNVFNIFGRFKDNGEEIEKLDEVTIQSTPDVLRAIANMLINSANELEKSPDWDHVHLQDDWEGWSNEDPDIIVVNPKAT